MQVIDPGHEYLLDSLDGVCVNHLVFVKRVGEKYPGNTGSHPGTTMQEVLRTLVERAEYVGRQVPCEETSAVIYHLKMSIYLLEMRAARCHGRSVPGFMDAVRGTGKCSVCGHVGCDGFCHAEDKHA